MQITEFIEHPDILNDQSLSAAQRMALKATYGLELTDEELELFYETSGLNEYYPKEQEEVTYILGRRSGKSDKLAANIALYEACSRRHNLSTGQVGVVMVVASEKQRQAQIVRRYIEEKLKRSRVLRRLIRNITVECISLSNGVEIQCYPCSVGKIRGVSMICFIADECAFWKIQGKDVDEMVLESARPALDFSYSKLIKISTPYMQRGEIYKDFKNYYGKAGSDVLVFKGSTELFNPSYSRRKLERMRRRNPVSFATEYEAQFRTDLSAMYDPEVIDQAVNHDRPLELPPRDGLHYVGFVDVAGGGGGDSYAVCIGHMEGERAVIDLARSRFPKFNPQQVTKEACELLMKYGIHSVMGDKFSGDWAANSFAEHGVFYERSPKTKSELYVEVESFFNTERIELPNKELCLQQFKSLVRRVRSGGKDSIDADVPEDEANVVAGVVWMLINAKYEKALPISFGIAESNEKRGIEEECVDWLLDRPKKKRKNDDLRDLEEIDREIEEELKSSRKSGATIKRGW